MFLFDKLAARLTRVLVSNQQRRLKGTSGTYIDGVGRQVTAEGSAAVLDVEGGSVLLIAGALRGVVFVVQEAGDVGQRTFLRRDPQIRRSGVEHDFEALRGSSDADGAEILRVQIVGKRFRRWAAHVSRVQPSLHQIRADGQKMLSM